MLSLALAALFWVALHLVIAGPLRAPLAARVQFGEHRLRRLHELFLARVRELAQAGVRGRDGERRRA